jgi:hypothetical protein
MRNFYRHLSLVSSYGLIGASLFSCNGTSDAGSQVQALQNCQVGQSTPPQSMTAAPKPSSVCVKGSVSMINLSGVIGISDFNSVSGDIVALEQSSIEMGGGVFLDGSIYLNDGARFYAKGGDTITGVVRHSDESANAQMVSDFIDSLAAMTPTQDFDSIYTTTVIHSTGAVNIVDISNIALFGEQKIFLAGAPHDVFVLNVSGNISTGGGGSGIYLGEDLDPRNVIINDIGPGKPVWIGGFDAINGTLIAGHRPIVLAGSNFVFGSLIGGQGISVIGLPSVWYPAGFCGGQGSPTHPTPSPSPSSEPSSTPTGSPSPTPSCIPAPSPTVSATPSPTVSPTPSPTPSSTATSTPTPTPSDTSTPSPTPSSTATSTPTPTPSDTSTPSPSPSPSSTDCGDVVCGGGPIGI